MVTPSGARRLGRFELRRVLGKGAQADGLARLRRAARPRGGGQADRAGAGADPVAVNQWLQRGAQRSAACTHPNIVPVFEADEHRRPAATWCSSTSTGRRWPSTRAQRGAHAAARGRGADAGRARRAGGGAMPQGIVHRDLSRPNMLHRRATAAPA
ncbi:MAG: hypothetical protein MZW92_16830 [Comamonadaceae bacterium]|nr:hypothetical protein [Comamonadaceae bacterium]